MRRLTTVARPFFPGGWTVLSYFRRKSRKLNSAAKGSNPRIPIFRPIVEGLEDRTLLASSLLVSGFPSATTAGVVENLTVTAELLDGTTDTAYAGTMSFTSSDSQAVLPADYTFTADDQGVHTFTVTLGTAGTQSLIATDADGITGTEDGIIVSPAAASAFTVSGFASSTTAGTVGSLTVTALDPYGNVATGYAGTVDITSSDAQAALPADYTFTAADAGTHGFSATLESAGSQSLTVADADGITGSQVGLSIDPAAANRLIVSGFASPSTAGTAGSFSVTALDPYGNVATGYSGTVHVTSSDGQAALPADYSLTASDNCSRMDEGRVETEECHEHEIYDETV